MKTKAVDLLCRVISRSVSVEGRTGVVSVGVDGSRITVLMKRHLPRFFRLFDVTVAHKLCKLRLV